jgi:hypothetical protein
VKPIVLAPGPDVANVQPTIVPPELIPDSFSSRTCISIEIELLPPELKLSGRVRISTAERESRSPLFSLSGNGPVCHPHAGSVCLGGCF